MVRWFGMLLVLTLLLCGCAQEAPEVTVPTEESTVPTTEATEPTIPPGLYLPESSLEQETNGAVRSFPLDSSEYYGCRILGEDIVLLHCEAGAGMLSLYTGKNLELVKTVSLGEGVAPDQSRLQLSEKGIGYYDPVDHSVVFLDNNLLEISRMQLPEEILGEAWLSPDWSAVYYCQTDGIHILDMQTGIDRLLKEQQAPYQEITGLLAGGTILRCSVEDKNNQNQTILVESSSGLRVGEGEYLNELVTCMDHYYIPIQTGSMSQLLFGSEIDQQVLWPLEEDGEILPLLDENATLVLDRQENSIVLSYYDLKSGIRKASVTVTDIPQLYGIESDGCGSIWFLIGEEEKTLCQWSIKNSPVEEQISYTAPYYTAENPDLASLVQLEQTLGELAEEYGVEILIWKDAAALAPADHVFTEEYLIQTYEEYLPTLEKAMSAFPNGFFRQAAGEKPLKIALVRAMNGEPQWGSLEQSNNLLFWQEDEPILGLVLGQELERNFYHGVFHLIETQVLSKSTAYYEWHKLNPKDFTYPNDYFAEFDEKTLAYAEGENRYFIDAFSMTYAKEDRARILEYACMPENEEYFQSAAIQKKLRRICNGIRETFDLEDVETPFLWEQYLKKKS